MLIIRWALIYFRDKDMMELRLGNRLSRNIVIIEEKDGGI